MISRRASKTKPEDQFRYALVPDSADARLFVELSGYANADLNPALHALESAIRLENTGDPDMHVRYLIEFAVVAYCRAFFHSNVRGRLTDHLEIRTEFATLHGEVCAFRNTTVAHSQSELSTTWPVLLIGQSGEPYVRDLLGANYSQTLPLPRVRALVTLIDVLVDEIDTLLAPVRARLLATARSLPVPAPTQTMPGIHHELDDTFNPRTRRTQYPLTQTLYMQAEPAE
ncbi:hypothetical protein C3B59_03855 [Cryobacterium zongtaii]|uniref:Uncharacterized protein n=1 Tax=Cryobacterium zongtaii TaxID=1259217 RepID=A0A2S3ZNR9_9MICO|nr:hypothetical protein [Cryobacterium zongtaii]POH70813.1 hypothetical protein C3B59_03855 [Cryobacterium zongtaii]